MPTARAALQARQEACERLKFRFFWGHSGHGVGPWVLSQWWEARTPAERIEVELLHPATGAWAGWYDPIA